MLFNDHSELLDKHAFLSPSNYHWINYSDEKLANRYRTYQAAQRGSEFHEFAQMAIKLGQKLARSAKTLNMYINDAIGFHMVTEQTLYFSNNAFGTADAIVFKNNILRIHDLKSGLIPAHMNQLVVYAALFCLEYRVDPATIETELRIYQNDEVIVLNPDPDIIKHIMDRIITFDMLIDKLRMEE